jgi:hypothetical protein
MRCRHALATLAAAALLLPVVPAWAEATDVTVRVLSRDAKFIGSSMGGVRITLSDARTGEPLATGVTSGGTGDTAKIMHDDRGRRAPMADDSAAAFRTTLDLERPRLIEVEAWGPLSAPQAAHTVTATQWLVPGRHLSGGDGWVLEMPGFVVDVLAPGGQTALSAADRPVEVRASVEMMCGCPIEPGGLWDADRYEVAMTVHHDGERMGEIELAYAGETSRFAGELPVDEPGVYEVVVHAHDPETGNTGLDRTSFVVE